MSPPAPWDAGARTPSVSAHHQDGRQGFGPSPDPPAELIRPRRSEPLCTLHDHHPKYGTSTPTSITVVATRTSGSPGASALTTCSRRDAGTPPWTKSTPTPQQGPSASFRNGPLPPCAPTVLRARLVLRALVHSTERWFQLLGVSVPVASTPAVVVLLFAFCLAAAKRSVE